MSGNKTRILLLPVLALTFILILGCTSQSNGTGNSSPWAPDTGAPSHAGGTPKPSAPNSSSIEVANQPQPYNFTQGQNASTGENSTANETGIEMNSTQGFFASLAMNSTSNITLSEFSRHSDASSCWTVIHGDVFDMTGWIGSYPGGSSKILNLCALDGTSFYENELSKSAGNSTQELSADFKGVYVG